MKDLLIGKLAIEYAASKTSSLTETALEPKDLADGAIGIYAFGRFHKSILVTAANAAILPTAPLLNTPSSEIQYQFAQGTASGCLISKYYKLREFKRVFKKEFQAAQNQISYIGFNGTSGTSILEPLTNYVDATIDLSNRFNQFAPVDEMKSVSATLLASDTMYSAYSKLAQVVNADAISPENTGAQYAAEVVSDIATATPTVFVGNVTFTNGSEVIAVATSHTFAVNDYLRLVLDPQTDIITVVAPTNDNSVLYKVIAITATTITLDRVFTGVTQTLLAADAITASMKGTTTPSNVGVRIIPYQFVSYLNKIAGEYYQFTIGTGGVIKFSPITYAVGINPGSGTVNHMTRLEKDAQISNGFWNTVDGYLPKPPSYINASAYDIYFLDALIDVSTTVQSQTAIHYYSLAVAFEDGASIGSQNQTTFDLIMTTVFGTSIAPIPLAVLPMFGDATPVS